MTREDISEAIAYIKTYRRLDERLHETSPKDSMAFIASGKCLEYWDMAIKALWQTGWIPVSERYPEDGQRVLVDYCDEDAGIMLIRFNVNGYRGFKAWMPLPKRYKASPTGAEGSEE